MKTVKLSKKADFKIRLRLFWAILKKKSSLQGFKLAIPAFVLCFMAAGFIHVVTPSQDTIEPVEIAQNTTVTKEPRILSKIDTIRSSSYKQRAEKRSAYKKALKYKQFALLRSSRIRNI